MKKISTLFKKNPENLGLVIDEINPDNAWVFDCGVPTRKFDGEAHAIINGELYKRYDVKKGRSIPDGAIPCQEPDEITGHWPHWVKCERADGTYKWSFDAWDRMDEDEKVDGTYELCGPKVQGNKEKFTHHILIPHGMDVLNDISDFTFDGLKEYLSNQNLDIEGIVFYGRNGEMCKIRKSDFGVKR